MFKVIQLLDCQESQNLCKKIYNLKDYILKSNDIGTYSLGAASYLHTNIYVDPNYQVDFKKSIGYDGAWWAPKNDRSNDNLNKPEKIDKERLYEKIKDITNPILMDNFKDLYQKICDKIKSELNEDCAINFEANLGFPGMNILKAHEDCEKINCPPHIDLQWIHHISNLKKIFKNVCDNRFLTFTLCLKLPKSGGGLYIWPNNNQSDNCHIIKENEEYLAHLNSDYSKILTTCAELFEKEEYLNKDVFEEATNPKVIQYTEGSMTLFDDLILHQVIPFLIPYEIGEERITMQGHGVKCDGIWRFFF